MTKTGSGSVVAENGPADVIGGWTRETQVRVVVRV